MLSIWDRLPKAKAKSATRRKAPSRPAPAPAPLVRAIRQVGTTTRAGGSAASTGAGRAVTVAAREVRAGRSVKPKRVGYFSGALAQQQGRSPTAQRVTRQVAGLTPEAIAEFQRRGLGPGGRSLGGFLTNLGAGAVRFITDAPAAAQLGAEAALYPVAAGYNTITGNRRGGNAGDRLARGIERQTREDLGRAGAGIKADYAYRYGPLVRGDLGEFGSRFYDDPLPTLLDVGGAYSVAGRAPAAAARGAAAVTTGRVSVRLERAGSRSRVAPGEIDVVTGEPSVKGGKLYRPPRRVTGTATGETPKGNVRTGSRTIERPRRPYSPNIITRAGQRGGDRLRASLGPRVERWAEGKQVRPGEPKTPGAVLTRPLTQQGKFDRAQAQATRDIIFRREQMSAGEAGRVAAPFLQATRKLKPDKNEAGVRAKGLGVEQVALRLHLEDVLSARGGLTATQVRDRVVSRMEQGIKEAERRGERTELTRRQVEQVKSIPPELLDLSDMSNPQVARVARALEEGRKLDKVSQARSVRAGVVTARTADEMRSRASALLLGGSEWSPALLRRMREGGASKSELRAVRALSTRESPKLAVMRSRLGDLDDRIAKAKAAGDTRRVGRVEAKRSEFLKAVRRQEDRDLGFTPPTRPQLVSDRGVYIPKRPVDRMGGGSAFPKRRGFSGPPRSKRDKGYLTQKGGFDMNPEQLAYQAKRATDAEIGPMSNAALEELIGIAAYLDDSGKMVSGKRAIQMARTDPDRVVLIHRGRLREVLAKLDDLDDGKFLDPADVKMFYGEGKDSWLQAIPDGPDTGQYVAISKAAADVWREAPTTNPILKGADTLLDYWKGGILALSPRWYVNSTIGVATQYGLMAGLDIRSMRQAIRKGPIKDAIPDPVVLNNLANDVGFKGGVNVNKVQRVMAAGFRTQNRLESSWRRAAYINRGKRALRDEGVKLRGLSDAEIARAIDNMPPSIARNVVRDVDLFLGEFRKFNRFERDVVKRVIPFYSWLRVISRLTLSLPFRSPVRAAAISTLGRAGQMGINPEDYARPVYERGALKIGKYRVPTAGFSSPATLQGAIQAGTRIADDPGSALGELGEEALAWTRPEIQTGLAATYGTTSFGNDVIAPQGYAGTTSGFGGREAIDPSTGLVERKRIRIPIDEAAFQAFGAAPAQALRRLVSAGERPFDTTRTADILRARLEGMSKKERGRLFLDAAKNPYRFPVAWGMGSSVGVNPYREDTRVLLQRYLKEQREFKAARRRQERKR